MMIEEAFGEEVRVEAGVRGEDFVHHIETPVGSVEEVRRWSDTAWSWPITHHMVQRVEDLKIIRYLFERVRYRAKWEDFRRVDATLGDIGVPFVQAPYTGMGFMMSRYAGVERTVMFSADAGDELRQTVETINAAHERVFRLLADGPSEVMFLSDNLSSDVQSENWFGEWSGDHYAKLATIAHEHGKPLSVHIDGRLRGLLRAVAERGIDGADAVTPAPWGDLSPGKCRAEAGPKLVLSGGMPPDSFAESVPLSAFDAQVAAWLELRRESPALIIAPGDQLPPDGTIERIVRMVEAANAATF